MSRIEQRAGKKTDPFYHSKEWEAIRLEVLRRDNYTCQKCQVKCLGKRLNKPAPHVDHIIPRKEDKTKALDPDNLRVLCPSCHSKITIAGTHSRNKPEIGEDGYPVTTG